MYRQVVWQGKALGQGKNLWRKPVHMLKADPVVLTLAQGINDVRPVHEAPKNRVSHRCLKADGSGVERPQDIHLNHAGHQRLQISNMTFNTATQVVGDYQQSMRLGHYGIFRKEQIVSRR